MNAKWLNSDGGPLIFCGIQAASAWQGTRETSLGAMHSDYDLACAVDSYLGVITSGSSQLLVLGDEPLQSTVIRLQQNLLLVRWVSCRSEIAAESVLMNIPASLPEIEKPTSILTEEAELVLFDSSCRLIEAPEKIQIPFSAGKYIVTTESFKVDSQFEFIVHRFLE